MTQNQIEFAKLKETGRHNRTTESIDYGTLSESARHNVEQERTNWYSAQTGRQVGLGQVAVGFANVAAQRERNANDLWFNQQRLPIMESQAASQATQAAATAKNAGTQAGYLELEQSKYNDYGKDLGQAQAYNTWTSGDLNKSNIWRNRFQNAESVSRTFSNTMNGLSQVPDTAEGFMTLAQLISLGF